MLATTNFLLKILAVYIVFSMKTMTDRQVLEHAMVSSIFAWLHLLLKKDVVT